MSSFADKMTNFRIISFSMLFLFALFYSRRHHPRPVMTESNYDYQTLMDHSSVIVDYTIHIKGKDQFEHRIREELSKMKIPITHPIKDCLDFRSYLLEGCFFHHEEVYNSVFIIKTVQLRPISKNEIELHIVVRAGSNFL